MKKEPVSDTLLWAVPVISLLFLLGAIAYVKIPPAVTRFRTMPDRLPELINTENWPLIERGLLLPGRPSDEIIRMQTILNISADLLPAGTHKAIALADGDLRHSMAAFSRFLRHDKVDDKMILSALSYGQRHFRRDKGTQFVTAILIVSGAEKEPSLHDKILLEAIKLPQRFESAFSIFRELAKRVHETSIETLPCYAEALDRLVGIADDQGKHAILDFLEGHNASEAPTSPLH